MKDDSWYKDSWKPAMDEHPDSTTECISCHEVKECIWDNDPFMEEIYHEITDVGYWCAECLDQRHMDI